MQFLAHERQLTWLDHIRLFNLVRAPRAGLQLAAASVERAKDVLDLAEVVDPHSIADSVVTMRSRVRLVRARGEAFEVTLSYPGETNAAEGRVSVFSPLGLSLLGAELGEVIEWVGPDGEAHFAEIGEILYQPEAAGDFTS